MYQSHWGISESPFRANTAAYYASPVHEEALARLDYLVNQHHRLGLLIGPEGSGKSLVLEVFAAQLRRDGSPLAKVNAIGLTAEEFLSDVAVGLGLNPGCGLSLARLWRLVGDRIAGLRYQRMDTVLLVDDADCAGRDVLMQLVRLARSELLPDSRLTLVLSGRPTRIGELGRGLLELADLRIDLEAWEPSDTAEFIATSLRKAGRSDPVFAPRAIARLHELSQGIPRRVSQLADLALVAGAGNRLDSIDADTVDSACRELGAVEVDSDEGGIGE
jgi:type II secretory pathway predicted ATPase ExeA